MTILDKIITEKKKEVVELKKQEFSAIKKMKQIPFYEKIKDCRAMSIIAEIKRASPSKGNINTSVDPVKQAKLYEKNGANAISVLTDFPFFKGSMDDLKAVREAVDVPILCKDFMIDSIQIDVAKQAGANIILLIAAALNDEKLQELFKYANEQDLEVLCEVHNEEEMERVLELSPRLIGINNRNLKTFHVDLETTKRLANMVTDPNTILISESGLSTKADIETVAEYGARAILVGETFMVAPDVNETIKSFQVPLHF